MDENDVIDMNDVGIIHRVRGVARTIKVGGADMKYLPRPLHFRSFATAPPQVFSDRF